MNLLSVRDLNVTDPNEQRLGPKVFDEKKFLTEESKLTPVNREKGIWRNDKTGHLETMIPENRVAKYAGEGFGRDRSGKIMPDGVYISERDWNSRSDRAKGQFAIALPPASSTCCRRASSQSKAKMTWVFGETTYPA